MSGEWYRKAFGAHYPVLYAHRDEAEAGRCLDLLPELAPLAPGIDLPILDLGCGDGRHLAMLKERGHRAFGMDLSPDLLAAARQRGELQQFPGLVRADMRALPFQPGSFVSVLSLFTAFGYFSSDEDNQLVVNQISEVLAEGGHWFLDYLDGDTVRAELGDGQRRDRRRETGPLVVEESRILRESRVMKDVILTAREGAINEAAALGVPEEGLRYRESVAVFNLEEIDGMTARAGLRRVASAGGYEGQKLGEGTRWILVYCKVGKEGKS